MFSNYKTILSTTILFCLLLGFTSCKKDEDNPGVNRELLVSGTWRGTNVVGSYNSAGTSENFNESISASAIKFNENGTYTAYAVGVNGGLTETATDNWRIEGNKIIIEGYTDLLPSEVATTLAFSGITLPTDFEVATLSATELKLVSRINVNLFGGLPFTAESTASFTKL